MKRALGLSAFVALLVIAPTALQAQGYVVIRSMSEEDDGSRLESTLIQDLSGFFYGTADVGGPNGGGTVFKIDGGNNFDVLHGFNGDDGSMPQGRLVLGEDGYLYGVTARGGTHDQGVIFRLDRDGNDFSVLHNFEGGTLFWYRHLVQDSAGVLYGTNVSSPSNVFRIDTDGSNYDVLHTFANPSEGQTTSLMLASDGFLYGTTGDDTRSVFRLDKNGGNFETLHTFTDVEEDGGDPLAPLMEGRDGFLYGTAAGGGQYSAGTAFKLRKDGSAFEVIHDFESNDFTFPAFVLTQVAGGLLYGTRWAGTGQGGTVFRMTTSGEHFDAVHDFGSSTGDDPRGALMQGLDGALYGTTRRGGTSNDGVVYRLSIPSIASVLPSSGPAGGGTLVTIAGSGFQAGATVTIGGTLAGAVIAPSEITASSPGLNAGTLNDVLVTNPNGTIALYEDAWLADFLDVPQGDTFHDFVERIVRRGVTVGCGGGSYCRDDPVTRAQMAVFLLKAKHPPGYVPPPCTGVFSDVPCPSDLAGWIEQLAAEGITGGCGGGHYCPGAAVTRQQMAVFLLKTEHGSSYTPPACSGAFSDVACPSLFADWIEQLAAEEVTGGCGGGNYCPQSASTRGQMAVFLAKALGL